VGELCVTANGGTTVHEHTGRTFLAMGRPLQDNWVKHPPKPPKPPSRLAQEMALADDLMDVLSRMVVGWENIIGHDLAQHPDVQRVAARYRGARA